MKWVTRENANVDRIACPWLITRFIDPEAEFLFVDRDEVLEVADRETANSYDAPGARYTHRDGKCSFDVLVEEFHLTDDPALVRLAEIVHAADVSEDIDSSPEGRGLSAIAHGFALVHGTQDHKKIELESPMYDALYAWCQRQTA
ncbi:MAG: chromate resistance protein [Actinomycetota bacterium]|nr:chromate resistance protein [Actinomycetota bacterium]